MKNILLIAVFCFSAYFPKATTDLETVWLKDITTRLQADKRTLSDNDLPDRLSFRLKRKSQTLTLNLKRNYDVDPNADVYTVKSLNDGRSILEKTDNVENEDVAYYQDRENGAFMTAICVKRLNGQCDIRINGNIRIGGKNYDLQPSKNYFTSEKFVETTDLLAKRYFLQDQSNIESNISLLQDQSNVERDISLLEDKSNVERDIQVINDQLNIKSDQLFLQDQENVERDITVERKDPIKKEYYVKVLVLLDSSVWDLFVSLLHSSLSITEREPTAIKNMNIYYSHIMNGIDQFYKGINDPDIEINIRVCAFIVFQWEAKFPHIFSKVEIVNGTKRINASSYIVDLVNWDLNNDYMALPEYDQVILFTRHWMYRGNMPTSQTAGLSLGQHVCVPGYRVLLAYSSDYFRTVSIASHELGHALGALHDRAVNSRECKAKYGYIMDPLIPVFDPKKKYSKKPWRFSKCSVEAFKTTLANKNCVKNKHYYMQDELEHWNNILSTLPGQVYTPSMQCELVLGRGSVYCGALPEMICRFMYCTDPKTNICIDKYYNSAPGTTCGINMWCKKGVCVKQI